MATKAEIRNRAAERLGLRGRGQTLDSESAADLDTAYAEVYAQLDAKGAVTWDFDEAIPDEYAPHVVALVAYARLANYGVPDKRTAMIGLDAQRALPEIRALQSTTAYDRPTALYF